MSSDESEVSDSAKHEAETETEIANKRFSAESRYAVEESTVADAEESNESETARAPNVFMFGAAALCVAALIAAVIFGVTWLASGSDDSAQLATSRDDVARVGTSAVKAFTELDFNKPDQYFDQQVAVATDDLAKQVNDGREANKKTLSEAKTTASTRVLDIAVDELNQNEGKARFLAAIQVTVNQNGDSSVKPLRIEANMTKVGQDWKLASIEQVPVANAGK